MSPKYRRSFRIVCPPQQTTLVEALLHAQGFVSSPEPFSPFCHILEEEPRPLGSSLAAAFGFIYIQDRSSMLPPLALPLKTGDAVIDMCASPGSKTGFLAQLTGPEGFVLGNEPTRSRLATLRANLHTLNLLQVATCSYPGEKLPLTDGLWERILLDPPCSGWGTAEKHPHVLKLWKGENIQSLISLQRRLLARAARLLRPGGLVVYSTCTTNDAENEDQVRWAVEMLGLEIVPLMPFAGFAWAPPRPGGEGTLRVDGARCDAQGFYIALLRKPDTPLQPMDTTRFFEAAHCRRIAQESLAAPCMDTSRLPNGDLAIFGDTVRFLPRQSHLLPEQFIWQGALLGHISAGRIRPASRLRALMPDTPPKNALVLDDIQDIQALLQGQSRQTGLPGRETGLYWQNLPLARVTLRNGRALWRA